MEKTTGYLNFEVWVTCPFCKEDFDLNTIHDDDYRLSKALFGEDGKANYDTWDSLELNFQCPNENCEMYFQLERIEY